MAEIVAGIGVPHSPHYPSQIARDGPEPAARNYREIASHLDAARPDAIVVIANDHFNTFFMNNFPTFAIGVAETSYGPNDQTKMPRYDFKVQSSLASHMRNVAIKEGFDLAVTQEFGVDHAMLVPLHYVTDGMKIPVVPIWVNAFVAPLPTARRCYALGQQLRSRHREHAGKDARGGARLGQLLARDRWAEDQSGQTKRRARYRMVEAHPSPAWRTPRSTNWSRKPRPSGCGRPAISAASF